MVSGILVAAGKGTRMGPNVDKLFLELNGRPVITHSWRRLDRSPSIEEIVLVIREDHRPTFELMAAKYGFSKPFRFTAGGAERQDSVWNGLQQVSTMSEIVVIQDAARPCTSPELILETIAAAREVGAAVAAQPMTDTVKASDDGVFIKGTLDRSRLWTVQTPQTFRTEVIRRALLEVRRRGLHVTDDTAACELIGQKVKLVASAQPNPKVTRPEDLSYIESLLRPGAV